METPRLALVGGTLIDGTGRDPAPDAVVLVNGDRLEYAGSKRAFRLPRGCPVVDVTGKSVMPGMIDCHVHISWTTANIEKRLFIPPALAAF
jgi:imidazolonepropionase-like amidohydrolase